MSDSAYYSKVLSFDAATLLATLMSKGKIKPFTRRQDISVDDVLPVQPEGYCACGCGVKIKQPRRKWATDNCCWFGYALQGILIGDTKEIARWLKRKKLLAKEPICCEHCKEPHAKYEVDHILAVALGGAGQWLDNYALLCHKCHSIKTSNDRKLISAFRKALKLVK